MNPESKSDSVRWPLAAGVALLTFAAFSSALRNQFVSWDDARNFVENANFRGLAWPQLRWMFTTFHGGLYMPLTWISCGLDYVIWKLDPFGYHLTNLCLHAANAILFYRVARILLERSTDSKEPSPTPALEASAALAALLFSLHPLRVESVVWATERRDVLSGFFFLCSVLFYLRYAQGLAEGSGDRRPLWGSYLAYAFSLFSKPGGLPLPAVLMIIDAYTFKRSWKRSWKEKIPYVVLAAPVGWLAMLAQRHVGAADTRGISGALALASYGTAFYLRKTLVPWHLSPFYAMPAIHWQDPRFYVSAAAVFLVSAALAATRKRRPALAAAGASYLLLILPVSGAWHAGMQIAADRYSYLACMPWALLGGGVFAYAWRVSSRGPGAWGRRMLAGTGVGVICAMGFLTHRLARVWHDSESLWDRVLAVDPQCALAHTNLAQVFLDRGDTAAAVRQFQAAFQTDPDFAFAHNNLGSLLLVNGRLQEAEEQFLRAIAAKPNLPDAYLNLGVVLASRGDASGALEQFKRALSVKADYEEAYNNIGRLLAMQGKIDESIPYYRKALEINPGYAPSRRNLDGAVQALERARK